MPMPASRRSQRGFTLIEMVVALVMVALLITALAGWLVRPTEALVALAKESEHWRQADLVSESIAEDLRAGLPNSARIACAGRCLELLRVESSGEYRVAPPGDGLTIGAMAAGFDTLTPLDVAPLPTRWIVIGGLTANATPPFGVYASGVDTVRAPVGAGSTTGRIQLLGHRFPAAAVDQRFHVVSGAVSYLCSPAAVGGVLRRRTGYGVFASQPTNTSLGTVLARDVTDCRFEQVAPNLISVVVSYGAPGSRTHHTFMHGLVRGQP